MNRRVNAIKKIVQVAPPLADGCCLFERGNDVDWHNIDITQEDSSCILELRELYNSTSEADGVDVHFHVSGSDPDGSAFPTSCIISVAGTSGDGFDGLKEVVVKEWPLERTRDCAHHTVISLRTIFNIVVLVTGQTQPVRHLFLGLRFVGCSDKSKQHRIACIDISFGIEGCQPCQPSPALLRGSSLGQDPKLVHAVTTSESPPGCWETMEDTMEDTSNVAVEINLDQDASVMNEDTHSIEAKGTLVNYNYDESICRGKSLSPREPISYHMPVEIDDDGAPVTAPTPPRMGFRLQSDIGRNQATESHQVSSHHFPVTSGAPTSDDTIIVSIGDTPTPRLSHCFKPTPVTPHFGMESSAVCIDLSPCDRQDSILVSLCSPWNIKPTMSQRFVHNDESSPKTIFMDDDLTPKPREENRKTAAVEDVDMSPLPSCNPDERPAFIASRFEAVKAAAAAARVCHNSAEVIAAAKEPKEVPQTPPPPTQNLWSITHQLTQLVSEVKQSARKMKEEQQSTQLLPPPLPPPPAQRKHRQIRTPESECFTVPIDKKLALRDTPVAPIKANVVSVLADSCGTTEQKLHILSGCSEKVPTKDTFIPVNGVHSRSHSAPASPLRHRKTSQLVERTLPAFDPTHNFLSAIDDVLKLDGDHQVTASISRSVSSSTFNSGPCRKVAHPIDPIPVAVERSLLSTFMPVEPPKVELFRVSKNPAPAAPAFTQAAPALPHPPAPISLAEQKQPRFVATAQHRRSNSGPNTPLKEFASTNLPTIVADKRAMQPVQQVVPSSSISPSPNPEVIEVSIDRFRSASTADSETMNCELLVAFCNKHHRSRAAVGRRVLSLLHSPVTGECSIVLCRPDGTQWKGCKNTEHMVVNHQQQNCCVLGPGDVVLMVGDAAFQDSAIHKNSVECQSRCIVLREKKAMTHDVIIALEMSTEAEFKKVVEVFERLV